MVLYLNTRDGWSSPSSQGLRIPDDKSQTRAVVPLLSRPSVRGVPQLHGSMTLVERRRTIYFRAEDSNVAEQERYKGLKICNSRSDSAAHHEKSRCASSQHQLRSPACAKCPGCTRVAGELRSRRAAEINLTINYALNVDMCPAHETLLFSFSCRVLRLSHDML